MLSGAVEADDDQERMGLWSSHCYQPQEGAVRFMKLFVGNLSWGVDDDMLNEAFGAYGAVDSATVVADRQTGRSRGFGFVEMGDSDEARAAIEALNGTELDGRELRIDEARSRDDGPREGF